jgi:hypothetical protein
MIWTVQQIEEACERSQPPAFDRYLHDLPETPFVATFYPLGFPVAIHTNSEEVLRRSEAKWGIFTQRFGVETIVAEIIVLPTDETECPPLPQYRFFDDTMVMTADASNYCIVSFNGGTRMVVTTATLRHPAYFSQVFLDAAVACQIGSRYTTGIHSGCVALDGRGILLCGDSGAGKTSLSWGCARAGWDFVADDTSHMLHGETRRIVIGNSHQVRFRPSAAELFPEVVGVPQTPRIFGRPSIELPTAPMTHINTRDCAHVDFIVFLNRRIEGAADLVPYRKDVARAYMRQWLFGTPESKALQHAAIERLLSADVLELRYQSLSWAISRLEQLVREGRP